MTTQLERFQKSLGKSEFDFALISSELNIRYLCDFSFTDGYLLISESKAFLLTDSRYIEAARSAVSGFEVMMPTVGMLNAAVQTAKENGCKSIAVEECALTCADFKKLSEKAGDIPLLTGISQMLTEQRAVKLPYEAERMKQAQSITDLAFEHILPYLSPKVTERDVALELEFFMRRQGAEAVAFDTIAVSGSASSLPHGVPSDIHLRSGFLTMDFGAKYRGYCSDMTRTVVIGRADSQMKEIYNTVLSAQTEALAMLSSGVSCKAADGVARQIIEKAGYGKCFGHSLGHGVGIYIHEFPRLSPAASAEELLCVGNTVTVEPGIYIEGKYGCRIEDMVMITEDGIYNFTKSKKELIEI